MFSFGMNIGKKHHALMNVNLLTPMSDQEKIFLYNINITSTR